jgi:hypothetical protein
MAAAHQIASDVSRVRLPLCQRRSVVTGGVVSVMCFISSTGGKECGGKESRWGCGFLPEY